MEIGLPEVDPYDRRVVSWIGRRLYLVPFPKTLCNFFTSRVLRYGV
jgi:hypothetical protein